MLLSSNVDAETLPITLLLPTFIFFKDFMVTLKLIPEKFQKCSRDFFFFGAHLWHFQWSFTVSIPWVHDWADLPCKNKPTQKMMFPFIAWTWQAYIISNFAFSNNHNMFNKKGRLKMNKVFPQVQWWADTCCLSSTVMAPAACWWWWSIVSQMQ